MFPGSKGVAIALLIIAVGVALLLNTLQVIPGVNWVWTLALAAAGVVVLAISKFDKVSFVVGFFLIVASLLSVMRQTGRMSENVEGPVLVIGFGVLLLVAQLPVIRAPEWFVRMAEDARQRKKLEESRR